MGVEGDYRERGKRCYERELATLKRWKEDALRVDAQWDVQAVGREMDLTLGKHIRPAILPFIQRLKKQLAERACDVLDASTQASENWDEVLRLKQRLAESEAGAGKLREALEKIAHYDNEPIWTDDRDDSADDMLRIARRALKGEPLEDNEF